MVPDENGVLDWNTLKPLKMYTDTVFKLDDHEIFVGSNSFVRDGGETVEYTALMIKKLACESNNLSNDLTFSMPIKWLGRLLNAFRYLRRFLPQHAGVAGEPQKKKN